LLEDAARATGSFAAIRPSTFPDELRTADLPAWALDPREEEEEHGADDTRGRHYQALITYVAYLAVECGQRATARSAARTQLDGLRNDYLTELPAATGGDAQKRSRTRSEISNGELTLMVDALDIRFAQTQIFTQ
jgi:hypothetical protein